MDVVAMAQLEELILAQLEPLVRVWEREFPDGSEHPSINDQMARITEAVTTLRRLRGRDGN